MSEPDLSKLQNTIEKQSENITKLLIVCDVLSKTVSKHEQWITDHQDHYQQLKDRMLTTELTGKMVGDKLDNLAETMTETMNSYLADKGKIVGGWWILSTIGSVIVSIISLMKAFHMF